MQSSGLAFRFSYRGKLVLASVITDFVAFLLALMVGAVLTIVVRNRAVRLGWYDQANSSRKVHAKPVPRLGGVAIVLAFNAPITALLFVDSGVALIFREQRDLILGLYIGGFAIAALGLYDDLYGAGARLKFSVQTGVALLLYAIGFRIEILSWPFGPPLALGMLALPFTVLWIVGVINAINLIDGLDGLAGGVALFVVATSFILAFSRHDVLVSLAMAALGGAVLGFLIFNFNPASIFMGDTGSMFLGFVLAAIAVKTSTKSGTTVAMLVPVIALGLPIMDTLLAMIRRAVLGRSLFDADKDHIHHRLMSRLRLSQRSAVLVLYALCCLFALTALGLAFANGMQSAMLLIAVSIVVFVLMRKLGYLDLREGRGAILTRRRNQQLRSLLRDVVRTVQASANLSDLWNSIRPLAEELGVARLELRIHEASGPRHEGVLFETERPAGSSLPVESRVELAFGERRMGHLSATWRDGRVDIDRDDELALELIADAVAAMAARLTFPPLSAAENVVPIRR
jgi:UDP-GlcNAc:undecaprenyl-phosphate/decaprenyl-phosphate GlcNAc-1-phosphate transferase